MNKSQPLLKTTPIRLTWERSRHRDFEAFEREVRGVLDKTRRAGPLPDGSYFAYQIAVKTRQLTPEERKQYEQILNQRSQVGDPARIPSSVPQGLEIYVNDLKLAEQKLKEAKLR